jgi:hypothetical protein
LIGEGKANRRANTGVEIRLHACGHTQVLYARVVRIVVYHRCGAGLKELERAPEGVVVDFFGRKGWELAVSLTDQPGLERGGP